MAYDPYNPNANKHNKSPLGGQLEDWAREQERQNRGTGNNELAEGSKGFADVMGGVQQVFYGDQNQRGLIGGTYQVNPNAWWDVSGDPYRSGAVGAGARGPSFSGVEQDQSRLQQQGLIQMLQNQAAGIGPSLAQGQLQQATERNINAAASMAASGRGPGANAGAYNANMMASQANQQAAMDSAQLRMQEQLQAQGLLGSVLGQTRGQDQSFGQLQLQDQKMRDDLVVQFMKMGYDADQANREAAMQMEKLKMDAYNGGEGGGGFFGGLLSGLS